MSDSSGVPVFQAQMLAVGLPVSAAVSSTTYLPGESITDQIAAYQPPSQKRSAGEIAGISIGVVAAVALTAGIAGLLWFRSTKRCGPSSSQKVWSVMTTVHVMQSATSHAQRAVHADFSKTLSADTHVCLAIVLSIIAISLWHSAHIHCLLLIWVEYFLAAGKQNVKHRDAKLRGFCFRQLPITKQWLGRQMALSVDSIWRQTAPAAESAYASAVTCCVGHPLTGTSNTTGDLTERIVGVEPIPMRLSFLASRLRKASNTGSI